MKFLLLAAALCLSATLASAALSDEDLDRHFTEFKTRFNRQYNNPDEELRRRTIFGNNLEIILEHNKQADQGLKTYRLGVNEYADMSNAEFRRQMNGYRMKQPRDVEVKADTAPLPEAPVVPGQVDWTLRKPSVVTPIKNQGQCGSCWAFSAVASLEGQHALKTGKLVSLSEQNLVDCSFPEGDMGCLGGLMDNAFRYVIINHGLDTEASYPYKAEDGKCVFKKTSVGATVKSYHDIPTGNETALKIAVATVGPISVAIDASHVSFQLYESGVYNEPACSTTALDHGVTAVGYGTLNGKQYWKVKNSWGTTWGEKGYILMSRDVQNQCGIATKASYPIV